MKPDAISVRVLKECELDADSADLQILVEGSSFFSGAEAFKKAKELRALLDALKELGIEENRAKLRNVELGSSGLGMVKASSVEYTITVRKIAVDQLAGVLGLLASRKGVSLMRLDWNYGLLRQTRERLRREALAESVQQARSDAEVLGVKLLGVYQLTDEVLSDGHRQEYVKGDSARLMRARSGSGQDINFELGNSTTVTVVMRAEFRVGGFGEA